MLSQTLPIIFKTYADPSPAKTVAYNIFKFVSDVFDAPAFCMSEDGDLLSQWRGYADDGYGVSIGFSSKFTEQFENNNVGHKNTGIILSKVAYDQSEHESIASLLCLNYLEELGKLHNRDLCHLDKICISTKDWKILFSEIEKLDNNGKIKNSIREMLRVIYNLKNRAFREEREWRLWSNGVIPGNLSVGYKSIRHSLIAFLSLPISEKSQNNYIETIYLGPKHKTSSSTIQTFLEINGLPHTKVLRSSATYR